MMNKITKVIVTRFMLVTMAGRAAMALEQCGSVNGVFVPCKTKEGAEVCARNSINVSARGYILCTDADMKRVQYFYNKILPTLEPRD